METLKVGIREFRNKLASYLLESDVSVAITRHGDTVGYLLHPRTTRTHGGGSTSAQGSGLSPTGGTGC